MARKTFLLLLLLYVNIVLSFAQECSIPGQRPSSSIRICDSLTFQQDLPKCDYTAINGPCPLITGRNPVWYRFSCYSAGKLGFTIFPTNINDDYDWQLFDITNHCNIDGTVKEDDVYNDPSLFVACDWSGETGVTGAGPEGLSLQNCNGEGVPTFSSMPEIFQGHEYLLLVSHAHEVLNSFSLRFNNGTASVVDTLLPHLKNASMNCDGSKIIVVLNKKLKSYTLSTDVSEFSINGVDTKIISAKTIGDTSWSVFDTVELDLETPLPAGNYAISIGNGTDGNTLADNCNNNIAPGESIRIGYTNSWNGSVDSAWENPLNWDCQKMPGDNTDVVINNGAPNYPFINSNATCKSIKIGNGAIINVQAGYKLDITGRSP